MFNLAEVWGFRPDGSNPCRLIERFRESKRERFLSDVEIAKLGTVLTEIENARQESDVVLNAIRVLLLTGCRLGEALALRWEDVDPDMGTLAIRDAKAGARLHHIGALTVAFLAQIPKNSKWVLPSADAKKALSKSTLEHAWTRIRARAGLQDVRLHDLRHTVGTYAGQTGANAFLVPDKLGHETLAMTGRYVNRDADPIRALSDAVERRINAALNGDKRGAEVVLLDPNGRHARQR
jgi:integrase